MNWANCSELVASDGWPQEGHPLYLSLQARLGYWERPTPKSQQFITVKSLKNPPASVGETRDTGLIPGLGRSPGVGSSNPLQCSCLENSMVRGAWWAIIHEVAKSWAQLSMHPIPTNFSNLEFGINWKWLPFTKCLLCVQDYSMYFILIIPFLHINKWKLQQVKWLKSDN